MYLCSSLFRFCDKNKSNEKGRIPSEEADLNFRDAKKFYRTPIIINYFEDRLTNASAESFNAKIKAFRTQFRGVGDIKFFMYRQATLYS